MTPDGRRGGIGCLRTRSEGIGARGRSGERAWTGHGRLIFLELVDDLSSFQVTVLIHPTRVTSKTSVIFG